MKYVRRLFLVFMLLFVPAWAGIEVITIQQAQTIQDKDSIGNQDLEKIDFLFVRHKSFNFMSQPPQQTGK